MDNRELLSIIESHRTDSLGGDTGDLSAARATAMDHYHGRPYGNEVDGRSQVVSKDLHDAIDWVMPAIMKVFVSSGNIAEFVAIGPEDEQAAMQESDYVNQVIMQDNDGFLMLHDACKDALILNNGYVKHWWDTSTSTKTEEYSGITLEELYGIDQRLTACGADVKILSHEIRDDGTIDVEIRITTTKGRCRIEAVPAEEIRVSSSCRGNLQDSKFVEHVTRRTRSDLIEMGMSRDFVSSLPSYDDDEYEQIKISRDRYTDEDENGESGISDRSMDEIEYCESYLRVDFDGDGIAELRRVVSVGGKIPDGDEWNDEVEAVGITGFIAKRVPHRHIGESIDDDIADLQEIKTTLLRQLLDNIYRTTNTEWLVNERVNLSDFMLSLPGGVKRVEGDAPVDGCAQPVVSVPILDKILPVVDYIDNIKENRTGITKASTGMDPDLIKNSTKAAFMENLQRASQKVEMIIRMLAETGVKELVIQVHGILLRHQDKQRIVKLRGKYTPINPREWGERTDLAVRVGLGTGTEDEKRQKLMVISQLAGGLQGMGLFGPEQAYNLFSDISETLGYEQPEKYLMRPGSPQHQAQMQQMQQAAQGQDADMLAKAEQVKGQFMLMKEQAANALHQAKQKYDNDLKLLKMEYDSKEADRQRQFEAFQSEAERRSREAIEAAKLEMQALLAGFHADLGPAGIGTMPSAEGGN